MNLRVVRTLLARAGRRRRVADGPDPARRDLLRAGLGALGGMAVASLAPALRAAAAGAAHPSGPAHGHANLTVGEVDLRRVGFDPLAFLTTWDRGVVQRLPGGRTLREFRIVAYDRPIEIAPGLLFPAWTFNGTVPGPTLRATEGDRVRVHFVNAGTHPHTLHFHGIHTAEMDGVPGVGPGEIRPGGTFTYEFDAVPFGVHLYHCHALPLKRHIHKGLYGVFIVDPRQGRPPARELVMVMNAFDTNFDGENEVYAVNTVAFYYARHPIRVRRGELVRIYLVNVTEFDPINSIHIHGNFFHVYRTGTSLTTTEYTDTIMLCQAERAVLELRFPYPGRYMFHAHQSEFTELGWMGMFEVTDGDV
jgi:FtsP/CotA-like multicopper oxidase with cupredoxin domain